MKSVPSYRLGLPAWAYAGWERQYFGDDSSGRLAQYAEVFNCVEGNTTFYSIPSEETVRQWQEQLEGKDFHFCFKLPREVTHHQNGPMAAGLNTFFQRLEPLAEFLGPFMVQLPASVGPDQMPAIRKLLAAVPQDYRCAIEVRHPEFFISGSTFDEYFADTHSFRVIMDSRPIHKEEPHHPEVLAARHAKPDVPVFFSTCSGGVLVRLVYHPDEHINEHYTQEWIRHLKPWITNGEQVYMMIHCPNNQYCPEQAERFHLQLQEAVDLPDLSPWPLRQGQLF